MSCFLAGVEWFSSGWSGQASGSATWEVRSGKERWRLIFRFSNNDRAVRLRYLKIGSPSPDREFVVNDNLALEQLAEQAIRLTTPNAFCILGYEILRGRGTVEDMRLTVLLRELDDAKQEHRERRIDRDGNVTTVHVTP
jgi:hypothetical protein